MKSDAIQTVFDIVKPYMYDNEVLAQTVWRLVDERKWYQLGFFVVVASSSIMTLAQHVILTRYLTKQLSISVLMTQIDYFNTMLACLMLSGVCIIVLYAVVKKAALLYRLKRTHQ